MLKVYRILTYVLLPFGAIIALFTLVSLLAALGNIAALFPLFTCGGTLIYLVSSFNFLHQGILYRQPQKPSLFDWIRVNAFVALFLGISFVFQSIYFRFNTEFSETIQAQFNAMAKELETKEVPDLAAIIRGVLNFMLVSGLLLITHVALTLVLLKKHFSLFGKN